MSQLLLRRIQSQIASCRKCPNMVGGPVHGAAVLSRIFLLGQAPGPREESFGKPFAYTAGKTLFKWFEDTAGIDEEHFRAHVYMAAVARCFPGKARGGGDRVPHVEEIDRCKQHLVLETGLLKPKLILPVGKLAISQVLGREIYTSSSKLNDIVGHILPVTYLGQKADMIALPHPSGLSSWHKTEPGKSLLKKALKLITTHPVWRDEME